MKVMIAGSRGINIDIDQYIPEDTTLIISGGAIGVDTAAERYADKMGISKIIVRPDYKKYGKVAPLIRNKTMVDMADIVIAIWDGRSRGTKDTIDYAIKTNTRLKIYTPTLK